LIVWDLERKEELARVESPYKNAGFLNYMLSYSGNKLLITAGDYSNIINGLAIVYDTRTMELEWSKIITSYASLYSLQRGAISPDGKEVIIEEVVRVDTGLRRGYFLYVLPDTTPRGYIFPMPSYWLQPKTPNSGYSGVYPFRPTPPLQHTWRTVNSVKPPEEQPLLAVYPNPTTGEVMVNVGACTSGTWSVRISDGVGRDAPERTEVCSDEILRMDLSAFPAGQYYLRLTELETGRTLRAVALLIR
jgi:hypothetical protein